MDKIIKNNSPLYKVCYEIRRIEDDTLLEGGNRVFLAMIPAIGYADDIKKHFKNYKNNVKVMIYVSEPFNWRKELEDELVQG